MVLISLFDFYLPLISTRASSPLAQRVYCCSQRLLHEEMTPLQTWAEPHDLTVAGYYSLRSCNFQVVAVGWMWTGTSLPSQSPRASCRTLDMARSPELQASVATPTPRAQVWPMSHRRSWSRFGNHRSSWFLTVFGAHYWWLEISNLLLHEWQASYVASLKHSFQLCMS